MDGDLTPEIPPRKIKFPCSDVCGGVHNFTSTATRTKLGKQPRGLHVIKFTHFVEHVEALLAFIEYRCSCRT